MKLVAELEKELITGYEEWSRGRFLTELAAGTLSQRDFQSFVQQDRYYLISFSKALSVVAESAYSEGNRDAFNKVYQWADSDLEQHILLNLIEGVIVKETKATSSYGEFLLEKSRSIGFPLSLYLFLPCYYFFARWAKEIDYGVDHPYKSWFEGYSGSGFQELCTSYIDYTLSFEISESEVKIVKKLIQEASKYERVFIDGIMD